MSCISFKIIPQFDILTIWSHLFGLLPMFCLFYFYNITHSIPSVTKIKKVRSKVIFKNDSIKNLLFLSLNDQNNLNVYSYKRGLVL